MAKNVEISFKIDGIEYTIDQLYELKNAAKKAGEEGKKAGKEAAEGQGFFAKKLDEVKEKFKSFGAALGDLKGGFQAFSGGLSKVAQGFGLSSKAANIFGKVTAGAIAATGIGLLVPLVLSLVNYFKNLEGGARTLQKIMAGLGAIVSNVGKALKLLVQGKFSDAFNTMRDAITGAVEATDDLYDAQRRLSDLQNRTIVENAKLTQTIEAQKKILEDTTLSTEERIKALDRVTAATKQLALNQKAETQEALAAAQAQLALATNYEERREKQKEIAELQASLIDQTTQLRNIEYDAAKVAREIETQAAADAQAAADEDKKLADEKIKNAEDVNLTLEQLRVQNIKDEAEKLSEEFRLTREAAARALLEKGADEVQIAQLNQYYNDLELAALVKLNADKALNEQQAADKEKAIKDQALADDKARSDEKIALQMAQVQSTANTIGMIGELAGEGTEIAKLAAIAQAYINTYLAASQALSDETLPTAVKPFAVAAIIGLGLKQVNTIANAKKPDLPKAANGGMIMGPSHSMGGVPIEAEGGEYIINKAAMGVPGVAQMASALNNVARPTFANGGMVGQIDTQAQNLLSAPIKTYVVATEMSTAQEANRNIERLARL